jgi:hypothetical protein
MKRIIVLVTLAAVFVAAALCLTESPRMAWAADSFTVSAIADVDSVATGWDKTNLKVIKAAWTASSIAQKADGTIPVPRGRLVQVVTDPGTTPPADNYDITLTDAAGVDVMGGALVNRDTANSEQAIPLMGSLAAPTGRWVYGNLTATFTELATADCDGVIYIYFAE